MGWYKFSRTTGVKLSDLSPWQIYKKNLGNSRPWDLINPNINNVPEEQQKARMSICNSCPELIKLSKQCKKCGCIMTLKTKLSNASCPIGKW